MDRAPLHVHAQNTVKLIIMKSFLPKNWEIGEFVKSGGPCWVIIV